MIKKYILLSLIVVITGFLTIFSYSFIRSNSSEIGTIEYLGEEYEVWIADNSLEQKNGLSRVKKSELESSEVIGMLFVFSNEKERTFWMKDMEFDLDVLWIKDGKILKIDRNIPAPKGNEEIVHMYSTPFEVDMVLELPAGEAKKLDMFNGSMISLLEK